VRKLCRNVIGTRAVRRFVQRCVQKAIEHLNVDAPVDKAVHSVRKELKKARAALRLLRRISAAGTSPAKMPSSAMRLARGARCATRRRYSTGSRSSQVDLGGRARRARPARPSARAVTRAARELRARGAAASLNAVAIHILAGENLGDLLETRADLGILETGNHRLLRALGYQAGQSHDAAPESEVPEHASMQNTSSVCCDFAPIVLPATAGNELRPCAPMVLYRQRSVRAATVAMMRSTIAMINATLTCRVCSFIRPLRNRSPTRSGAQNIEGKTLPD